MALKATVACNINPISQVSLIDASNPKITSLTDSTASNTALSALISASAAPLPQRSFSEVILITRPRNVNELRVQKAMVSALRMKTPESGRIDPSKLPEFLSQIPFYTSDPKVLLPVAIKQVALECIQESIQLCPMDFQLTRVGGSGTKGVSGAPVYLILNQDRKVLAVVKFLPKAIELPEELCALHFLQSLSLDNVNIISVLGIGSTKIHNQEYGIIIQSFAPGKALDDYMEAVVEAEDKTPSLKLLCDAAMHTGQTLAQIHTQTISDEAQPSYEIESHVTAVSDVTQKLKKKITLGNPHLRLIPILLDELQEAMIQKYRQHPGVSSAAHLDAHVGNFFYLPETACVTPIDTSSLSRSIASDGRGLVSPFRDVSYFKKKLYVFGLEKGMKLEAIKAVDDAFQEGYRKKIPAMATMAPEAAMFFEYRTILLFLQRYTDEIDNLEVTCREYPKKVECIKYMIDELNDLHHRISTK